LLKAKIEGLDGGRPLARAEVAATSRVVSAAEEPILRCSRVARVRDGSRGARFAALEPRRQSARIG
jgi:hypothetical protein